MLKIISLYWYLFFLVPLFFVYFFTGSYVFEFSFFDFSFLNKSLVSPVLSVKGLLSEFFLFGWSSFFSFIFGKQRLFDSLHLLAGMFGFLNVFLIFSILHLKLHLSKIFSLLGTFLCSLSFGLWFQSTGVGIASMSFFFVLLSIYYLLDDEPYDHFYKILFFSVSAACLSSVHFLFFIVVIAFFLVRYFFARKDVVKGFYAMAIFLGLIGFFFLYFNQSISVFFADFSFSFFNLLLLLLGFIQALFGLYFLLVLPFINELISTYLPHYSVYEGLFLVRELDFQLVWALFFIGFLAIVLFVLIFLFNFKKGYRYVKNHMNKYGLILFTGFFYSVCLSLLGLTGSEYWSLPAICFLIFFTRIMEPSEGYEPVNHMLVERRFLMALMLVFFVFVNFFGGLYFMKNKGNDMHYVQIKPFIQNMKENDLLVIGRTSKLKSYLDFYSITQFLFLDEFKKEQLDVNFVERVRDRLVYSLNRGGDIYIFPSAVTIDDQAQYLEQVELDQLWHYFKYFWRKRDYENSWVYVL